MSVDGEDRAVETDRLREEVAQRKREDDEVNE